MTFREVYKNEMSAVCPSEDLIRSILGKMRAEVQNPTPIKLSERLRQIPPRYLASAAAGICIIIAAAVVIPSITNSNNEFDSAPDNMALVGGESGAGMAAAEAVGDDGGMDYVTDDAYLEDAEDDAAPEPEATVTNAAPAEPANESDDSRSSESPPPGAEGGGMGADVPDYDDVTEHGDFDPDSFNVTDLPWHHYYDHNSYSEWPDAGLWDGLAGTFPAQSFPEWRLDYLTDEEITLPPYGNLGELLSDVLTDPHRITSVSFYYPVNPDGDHFGGEIYLYENDGEGSDVFYSLLKSFSELTPMSVRPGFAENGLIVIQISTDVEVAAGVYKGVSIRLAPDNTLTAGVYGSGISFNTLLEEGTYDTIMSYLMWLDGQ